MKMNWLIPIAAGLSIMLGCAETTSVEAPAEVNPNATFTATIYVIDTDSIWGGATSCMAILVPEIWTVDSLYGEGYGYSGPLDTMGLQGDPPLQYPAPNGYMWSCWVTPVPIQGEYGETGYAEAFISVSDSLGLFEMVFCAGYWHSMGTEFYYEENPCSCTVEVTPLSFEQETWGAIKTEFGK